MPVDSKQFWLHEWVFVDEFAAHNPITGNPMPYRQIFSVAQVDEYGKPTEVHPKVINFPHQPAIIVEITATSRIWPYSAQDIMMPKITREEAIALFPECELHSDEKMIPLHELRAKCRELYGKADDRSMERTALEVYRVLAKLFLEQA